MKILTRIMATMGLVVASQAQGAVLDIIENYDPATQIGTFTVTNNSGSNLIGFGVSNVAGQAYLIGGTSNFPGFDSFGCQSYWCYGARTLTASTWVSEGFDLLFNASFSDVVEPGENVIFWYDAGDGAMGDGETSSNFFAYSNTLPQSIALAYFGNGATYTNIPVNTNNNVPAPAALAMLLLGLPLLGRRLTG